MTFEARDSAAKVVPARLKPTLNSSVQRSSTKSVHGGRSVQRKESKKNTSSQTSGNGCLKSYKLEVGKGGSDFSPKNELNSYKIFTPHFSKCSRELMGNSLYESNRWKKKMSKANINKSPSAPDLPTVDSDVSVSNQNDSGKVEEKFPLENQLHSPNRFCQHNISQNSVSISGNLLLRPHYLPRQALSMDNSFYEHPTCFSPPFSRLSSQHSNKSGESKESIEMELGSNARVNGSQTSMALDLHECQVTLKVKDESANKRSYTSRKHQLLRQKPVEEDKDERHLRCSCIPRFLIAPSVEDWRNKTNSSLNLKLSCHHYSHISTRNQMPKMTADFRSHSFSPCPETKRNSSGDNEESKIFYVEDHRRKTNLSSENIKVYCEEKLWCLKKHSPCVSPCGSSHIYACRVHKCQGSGCFIHKAKDFRKSNPLVRSNARRKKCSHKIEGSLSAEEQNTTRVSYMEKSSDSATFRSASFSSTKNLFKSSSSSYHDSIAGGTSSAGRSPSPKTGTPPKENMLNESTDNDSVAKNNESNEMALDEPS